jgi:hypothetical protein
MAMNTKIIGCSRMRPTATMAEKVLLQVSHAHEKRAVRRTRRPPQTRR